MMGKIQRMNGSKLIERAKIGNNWLTITILNLPIFGKLIPLFILIRRG